jgi:hypothetical protein
MSTIAQVPSRGAVERRRWPSQLAAVNPSKTTDFHGCLRFPPVRACTEDEEES